MKTSPVSLVTKQPTSLKTHTTHTDNSQTLKYCSLVNKPRQPIAISLVEINSDLGASQRGASEGINCLKNAAIRNKDTKRHFENALLELENKVIQSQDFPSFKTQYYPYAKHIDAIYQVLERTATLVAKILQDRVFPVVLAGDHSTAAGTIAGIKKAYPNHRLGVIWIDAHADIHSPYTTPSGNMHGMPLAIATNHDNLEQEINSIDLETAKFWNLCKALGDTAEANLAFQDLVYVSVRDTEVAEDHTIVKHQIPLITTQDLRNCGAEKVAQKCLDYLEQTDIIYLSFDVDSMDSSICTGTGTPVSGGLWLDEAIQLNAALVKDPRVCCWEISEINPLLDTLNTMTENSLGVLNAVIEVIASHRLRSTHAK